MTGPFIAHETILKCRTCGRTFASDALTRLVANHCNVGYDVLVFVGRALFQRHRATREVLVELANRGVLISASEVELLGRKFITYIATGHRLAAPRIRQAMTLSGGYILHLDATHEGDAPALMTSIDSISRIVLANTKIASEHAGQIVPFLLGVRAAYGNPLACVHDMGNGILRAVADVFPGILDFVCHFHFLRDIGKDFLEPAYAVLRKRLRVHAISTRLHALVGETRRCLSEHSYDASRLAKAIETERLEDNRLFPMAAVYALSQWCLRGKHDGDGYGFPFDRPLLEFSDRLLELNRHFEAMPDMFSSPACSDNPPLSELTRRMAKMAKDPVLLKAVEELHSRCGIFDRLRKSMRIAPPGGGNGLNDDGTPEAMSTIRKEVEKFLFSLEKDGLKADNLVLKMRKQIDRYKNKLFADPIEIDTPNGKTRIYPQRTNNILERFFRELRRGRRRKTGNDSMRRTLQTMLADTPLVKNLDNTEYMEIFLNGRTDLEERFADLAAMPSMDNTGTQTDSDRMLPGFRRLIQSPGFQKQVIRLLSSGPKSN